MFRSVTNANLCMSNDLTVLDHPCVNNNPDGMVFFQGTTTDQMLAGACRSRPVSPSMCR